MVVKIFTISADTMTVVGFWFTVVGTLFGAVSLLLSAHLIRTTSKIQKNLKRQHLQSKYKVSKQSIMLQLSTSYSLLIEDKIVDQVKLDESIISLKIYESILTRSTKKKLQSLSKLLSEPKISDDNYDQRDLRNLLFEVIKNLENELDEHSELVKEVTK